MRTLFIGLVAMVALALGLAFGLGGQQTAAQITASWYEKGRDAGARVAEYNRTHQSSAGTGTTAPESSEAMGSGPTTPSQGAGASTRPEPTDPSR